MSILKLPPSYSSEKILLSSKEYFLPSKDKYIYHSFWDLAEKYKKDSNKWNLKDF